MKILDPVLVPDVSHWVTRLVPKEMEDGGCQSCIVGIYPKWQGGMKILNPISRTQCLEVMKTGMVLQAYYWDDITDNPTEQADWLVETIAAEGFPVKWIWSDQEQWWTDWSSWYLFRQGKIPETSVPRASGFTISSHNLSFNQRLKGKFASMGVYCNHGFVSTYAPSMNLWLPGFDAWVPHYGRQPAAVTTMTWQQLQAGWMPNYDIILASGQPPERVMGHQFTGDRIKLAGSYDQFDKPMTLDVSAFSKKFIDELRGGVPMPTHPDICPTCGQLWPNTPIPPVPTPTPTPTFPAYRVIVGHNPNVRAEASELSAKVPPIMMYPYSIHVDKPPQNGYTHFVADAVYPSGGWVLSSCIEPV